MTKPDADRARVSLLASHEHLWEKRRCLAGVQAIKSRFFYIYLPEIPIQYLYILSYSSITWGVLRCLLGFFGPLGPKTLRGQQYLYILSYSSITWGVLRCLLGFLALWGQKPCGGNKPRAIP